ncbi:hypothetical protein PHLGIDRAFT_24354 [Phlebiopsis gigantea 11061_1 CR5-6]|uniref:RRM domain-containing protein n=1 Tax=Phlebiopsis gigantea (strain 11061_1 CR5-6) TaxID=745531 RepID=A0A0C3NP58_PHLG1|nr:hypothetical protein PHLGIDRAFT_24354 [Phlebiopsis gigantea 11061_1 CR5-6]
MPSDVPRLNNSLGVAKHPGKKSKELDPYLAKEAYQKLKESWKRSISLRIYHVPDRMVEEDIRDLFAPYGEISDINIDFVGDIRMGMVAFNTPGSADKAMQAHEATPLRFEDKELQVRFGSMTKLNPPSKTLFCTNFRPDTLDAIEKRLTYLFSPWAVPKRFRYVPTTNMCFIDFDSAGEATKIIERHELRAFRDQGPILRLNYAINETRPPHHTLCVLGYRGDPSILEDYFPSYSGGNHIVEITSVPDRQGNRPPAYYVRFDSIEHATHALKEAEASTTLPYKAKYAHLPNKVKYAHTRPRGTPGTKGSI